jgi:hypothetical protein
MKYPFARSTRVALVALLPACGGGDFTASSGSGGHHADAAVDGSGSGGTTGATGGAGPGGDNSSGGDGSGGQQTDGGGLGSGGDKSAGGAVGSGGGDAGPSTDAGAGGTADAGPGTDGSTSGGGGGLGGAGGCPDPTTWYVDIDQDGYGSKTAPTVQSCSQPQGHYTKVGGDCQDNARDVHPQLTQQEKKFFPTPYKTPTGSDSFDYDCSGVETGDPSQPKAAASCPAVSVGTCGGSGYLPSNRGAGIANSYCGSQKFQTCKVVQLTFCSATPSDVMTPYACN